MVLEHISSIIPGVLRNLGNFARARCWRSASSPRGPRGSAVGVPRAERKRSGGGHGVRRGEATFTLTASSRGTSPARNPRSSSNFSWSYDRVETMLRMLRTLMRKRRNGRCPRWSSFDRMSGGTTVGSYLPSWMGRQSFPPTRWFPIEEPTKATTPGGELSQRFNLNQDLGAVSDACTQPG